MKRTVLSSTNAIEKMRVQQRDNQREYFDPRPKSQSRPHCHMRLHEGRQSATYSLPFQLSLSFHLFQLLQPIFELGPFQDEAPMQYQPHSKLIFHPIKRLELLDATHSILVKLRLNPIAQDRLNPIQLLENHLLNSYSHPQSQ